MRPLVRALNVGCECFLDDLIRRARGNFTCVFEHGYRLVPRDRTCKERWQTSVLATKPILGRPQHRCFHVFLTKWCEEPVTVGSRGPQFVVVHPGCTNFPVQPGCTNLGLSTLLQSRTTASDHGCAGCSQSWAKTEYKSSTAGVYSHTDTRRTYGEYQ